MLEQQREKMGGNGRKMGEKCDEYPFSLFFRRPKTFPPVPCVTFRIQVSPATLGGGETRYPQVSAKTGTS